jgi:nucleotide-binding universal stress UspA family protein
MYKRILIPTDGSKVARKAIKAGIALAKAVGASVVGYHAVEPIERIYYTEGAGVRATQVKAIEKQLRAQGESYLDPLCKAASAAGVACETLITNPADPYRGIIDAARNSSCDVICMASHGRGQIASALLGNVTHKVLTHSKVPVLVCR